MSCKTGKRPYPNVRSAKHALTQCQKRAYFGRQRNRHERSYYRCEFCGSWHLTEEPANEHSRFC